MTAKYRVGDRVNISESLLPGGPRGIVVHAFPFKQYALPDQQHYNVKLDDGLMFEVDEEDLNGNLHSPGSK